MSFNANANLPLTKPPVIPGNPLFNNARISRLRTDDIIGNFSFWKDPVKVATLINYTLSGETTINGVSVVDGDRVLVRAQTDASENGIYIISGGPWTRSPDMPLGSSASGAAVVAVEGTSGDDSIYLCTNDEGSGIVGTDDLVFESSGGSGGTPGGSNTQIQYNNAGFFGGSSNLTFNGTSLLTLRGTMNLQNVAATSAINVSLSASTSTASSYSLVLPVDDGTSGQVLSTDGSGILSWTSGGGGGSPGGSNFDIQYNKSGSFGGSSNFTFDPVGLAITSAFGDNVIPFLNEVGLVTLGTATTNQFNVCGIFSKKGGSSTYPPIFLIKGGDSEFGSASGSQVQIAGGKSASSGSGTGGEVSITGGEGRNTGNAGSISIAGGDAIGGGGAGNLTLSGGSITGTGSGDGGTVELVSGSGRNGVSGDLTIKTGDGSGASTSTSGDLYIRTGNNPGGSTSNSGSIFIQSGDMNSSSTANCGSICILGGVNSGSSANIGGSIFISPGEHSQGGTPGGILFFSSTTAVTAGISVATTQVGTGITAATDVTVAGTTVSVNTTFDGYTIGQVVAALRAYGLLA